MWTGGVDRGIQTGCTDGGCRQRACGNWEMCMWCVHRGVPPKTVTEAGGMYPTGIHTCITLICISCNLQRKSTEWLNCVCV